MLHPQRASARSSCNSGSGPSPSSAAGGSSRREAAKARWAATAKSPDQCATQAVIAAGLDAAGTAVALCREQAQELHGLSAKPAANLDTGNDEAAPPCSGEFWVGVVSLRSLAGHRRGGGPRRAA